MLPGNNQQQTKTVMKFYVKDKDVIYDWYNAYFCVAAQHIYVS